MDADFVDENGKLTKDAFKKLLEFDNKLANTLSLLGDIAANAKIQGRSEGIGTTVEKLDSSGIVIPSGLDLSRPYVNKTLEHIPDGAVRLAVDPNRYTGANRAFSALDSNNQLAGTFRNNPVNTQAAYTGANPLSQSGTTTLILVAPSTQQFGDGTVSYNSGSVDPGSLGLKYAYADDPQFLGGAVTYQSTTAVAALAAANGRVYFGQITTLGGGGGSGSGGGGGVCFSGNVPLRSLLGACRFDHLPSKFIAKTIKGWKEARLIVRFYKGKMRRMTDTDWLVTPPHRFKRNEGWTPARDIWAEEVDYEGFVFNAEILTDDDDARNYELENGEIAHNASPLD